MRQCSIKTRYTALGKSGAEIIKELNRRGVDCSASEFSRSINGVDRYPKSERICAEADKIVSEWEVNHNTR